MIEDEAGKMPTPEELARDDELARREMAHTPKHMPVPGEEIGEAATSGNVTKIPIKGPEGDTDLATQAWRKENWEPNERRAEVMAHAEDPKRTDAKEIDEAADLVERTAGQAEYKPVNTVIMNDSLHKHLEDRKAATEKFVAEHGDHPGFAKAGTTAEEAYKNQTGFSYQGFEVDAMRDKADDARDEANKAGEVAGWHYDNAQKPAESTPPTIELTTSETQADSTEKDKENVTSIVEDRNAQRAAERDRIKTEAYKMIEEGLDRLREADELDKEIIKQADGLKTELERRSS